MSGHLFVMRGDITKLSCDAWLATGDSDGPGSGWMKQGVLGPAAKDGRPIDNARFAGEVVEWTLDSAIKGDVDSLPQPWFADVLHQPVSQVMEFLEKAARVLEGKEPRCGRAKQLLAIPLAGVGKAGHAMRAGEVLAELLPRIYEWLERDDVDTDVVLVLGTDPHYFASQYIRGELKCDWTELESNRECLQGLAQKAKDGRLVLFLGAGVSVGAGLPDWNTLLKRLLEEVNQCAEIPREVYGELADLDPMDQPQAMAALLGTSESSRYHSFKHLIQAVLERYGGLHSLSHGLLSVIPSAEAVTTNYDQLFESACRGAGRERYCIPWEQPERRQHWLLKMHGCISRPETIVLSRRDYSLYDAEHGVLASIVQAMLVTRHMLFVGFGMQDPNFRAIFDTVKHAVQDSREQLADGAAPAGTDGDNFGAALFLEDSRVFQHIWERDVDMVPFSGQSKLDSGEAAAAARRLEIGLDYLGFACCQDADAPLLDPTLFQEKVVAPQDLRQLANIRDTFKTLSGQCEGVQHHRIRQLLLTKLRPLLEELGVN